MSGNVHVQTDMEETAAAGNVSVAESRDRENGEECRRIFEEMMSGACRLWLNNAVSRRDKGAIERGLTELQAKTPRGSEEQEDYDVQKAEHMVKILSLRDDLKQAVKAEDVDRINQLLMEVRRKRMLNMLQNEAMEGERALEMIKRKNNKTHYPLGMTKDTLSELRRYAAPPDVVHKVLIAALLLLGEDEHTTQDWKDCQRLCNPYTRNSLVQRVAEFDHNLVNPEIAARARDILEQHSFDQVHSVSWGAATFYVWARVVLDNLEPSMEGVRPASVDRQRQILNKPAIPGARSSPLLARRKPPRPGLNKYSQTDPARPGQDAYRPAFQ